MVDGLSLCDGAEFRTAAQRLRGLAAENTEEAFALLQDGVN